MILIAAFVGLMVVAEPQAKPAMSDCAACHEDAAKAFAPGPHGRAMGDGLDRSCVACHAPKPEHLESPDKTNVTRIPKDDACLSCHPASREQLLGGSEGHRRQEVACLDCHGAGHRAAFQPSMLKARPQQLCGSCHAMQRASFERPFTHRESREAMACTECHSPHVQRRTQRLSMLQNSSACVECHTDVAGPFVFEHQAQQVNGCSGCHESHGSTNPRMLKRRDVSSLCLECHANIAQFHDLSQPKFRACTNCHVAVHGSNRDAHLLDQ